MTGSATRTEKISLSFEPLMLTTAHPFGISYGTSSTSSNLLVRLSWKGLVGLGEASLTSYHDETPETVASLFKRWSDTDFLGEDPFAVEVVMRRLEKDVSGNRSAKAAVEMAFQDLIGKALGVPVRDVLGLKDLPFPITDFTIGIDSPDTVEMKVKEAVEAGYKHLKVKQGTDFDHEIINTVRKVAPDIPLRVDANGAWTVKRALTMAEFLKENGVEFIEQPLPKYAPLSDWQVLKAGCVLPIYGDESILVARDVARYAPVLDGVVVKLAKTGGIREAMRVIETARAHSLKVMFGCMIESSLGVTAASHLAALCDHLDLDGHLLLADDPFVGARYEDGYLLINEDLPGLGVVPRK